MFLLVPAYPGCPGSKAVKRSLLLLFRYYVKFLMHAQIKSTELQLIPSLMYVKKLTSFCLVLKKMLAKDSWFLFFCLTVEFTSGPPANIRYGPQSTFEPLTPVQIDSRLHCKMCRCTLYTILTVRLLHYHHIGICTYFISQQTRITGTQSNDSLENT